jgi:ubiquinol-cytochrome c reductase cytochrome b subunit
MRNFLINFFIVAGYFRGMLPDLRKISKRDMFRIGITDWIYKLAIIYPVPSNITYWWNFGVLALFFLAIQIISGIFLSMYYIPDILYAFNSVEHIMRDINAGWLLRYTHPNGASMFFIVVFLHMFRTFYQQSFLGNRYLVWAIGMLIFLLMIITAFLGYVLPWGQMSYWGATVITNLFSVIPIFGIDIVTELWGGYAVDQATLNRFFSLHFILPFILIAIVFLHLLFLHEAHSSNPLILDQKLEAISFHPYFIVKDLFGVVLFSLFFTIFLFFFPNLLGHPDNYIPANPLVTPEHIVPEWYFLLSYAILRSIPNKLIGVLALASAILAPFLAPKFHYVESITPKKNILSQFVFFSFALSCSLLIFLGAKPAISPYVELSRFFSFSFFIFLIMPISYSWNFSKTRQLRLILRKISRKVFKILKNNF